MIRRCVLSRNLKNEEAMACVGPQRQTKKKESNENLKSIYLNMYKYLRIPFDLSSYIEGEDILLI